MDDHRLTSLGYALEELAYDLGQRKDPLHRAFADHLLLVRQALWSLREDERLRTDPPAEEAIRAVLSPSEELATLIDDGQHLVAALTRLLKEHES